MTFPVVQAIEQTGFPTAVTTHAVNLPSNISSGDLLVMIYGQNAFSGHAAVTEPAGWSTIVSSYGSVITYAVFARKADETEGASVDVVSAAARQAAAQVYRITQWKGQVVTDDVQLDVVVAGAGLAPDPPPYTPSWGWADTLWIAATCVGRERVITQYPEDYTDGEFIQSGGTGDDACLVGSARRELHAQTEDPPVFVINAGTGHASLTIGIRPLVRGGTEYYPEVEEVAETSFATPSTSHLVQMPSQVEVDDLLIMLYTQLGSTMTNPAGWEVFANDNNSNTRYGVYAKKAVGDEGGTTVDIVSANSVNGTAQVYRINQWKNDALLTDNVEMNVPMKPGGAVSTISPNSLTVSWGVKDNLWIVATFTTDDDASVIQWSKSYAHPYDAPVGAGQNASARVASARRSYTADTDQPSTITFSEGEVAVAIVLGVEPGEAPIPVGSNIPVQKRRHHKFFGGVY